jgi:hypothetical protein
MSDRSGQEEKIVQVAVAPNEIIAGFWQSVLREEGIEVMLKSAGPGLAYFSTMGNQHVVYVLESQAEAARALIDELESEEDGEPAS